MFRGHSSPIIRSTTKTADAITGTVHVSVWFKSVERCPRSGVCFIVSWPIVHEIVLIVLLMMGAESTRNMWSNLAEKNNYNCLKLHRVGYLIKFIDDARNHKYKKQL
jgi:hypothetical protein